MHAQVLHCDMSAASVYPILCHCTHHNYEMYILHVLLESNANPPIHQVNVYHQDEISNLAVTVEDHMKVWFNSTTYSNFCTAPQLATCTSL